MLSNAESMKSVKTLDAFAPIEVPIFDKLLSGRELILAVEDFQNKLSARTLQENPFWRALVVDPTSVPERVFHGMCIENYHLLYRESYFDAPALSYAYSDNVRRLMNEFYCEEIGHDRLLLQSLVTIGLDSDGLFKTLPLSGTMALCNSLSVWARHDPLFFFTTLGPLEGRDVEIDSYVIAMERKGMPESFIGPIRAHAEINKNSEHGLLTREIFDEIPAIGPNVVNNIMRKTKLFIDIYDNFYSQIWHYYNTFDLNARRIQNI